MKHCYTTVFFQRKFSMIHLHVNISHLSFTFKYSFGIYLHRSVTDFLPSLSDIMCIILTRIGQEWSERDFFLWLASGKDVSPMLFTSFLNFNITWLKMALFVKPDFLSFLLLLFRHHGRQIFLGPMYIFFQQFLRMWIISSSHTSPAKRCENENFTTFMGYGLSWEVVLWTPHSILYRLLSLIS